MGVCSTCRAIGVGWGGGNWNGIYEGIGEAIYCCDPSASSSPCPYSSSPSPSPCPYSCPSSPSPYSYSYFSSYLSPYKSYTHRSKIIPPIVPLGLHNPRRQHPREYLFACRSRHSSIQVSHIPFFVDLAEDVARVEVHHALAHVVHLEAVSEILSLGYLMVSRG